MKPSKSNSLSPGKRVTRRKFLASGAAASAFMIVPSRVLGGDGQVPPSERVNLAFIGVGSQGLRVMLEFLKQPDVQAVSVCDPNRSSADYPQWGESEFCQGVRDLIGAKSGWEWLSPNQPMIRLTHSSQVPAGVAGREPCRKIVEGYYGSKKRSGEYRGCAAYADFRELLEKEKDFDAVVVGSPDHLHAPIAVAAMKQGKHIFCQKPMTHDIYEARIMAQVAREKKLATQVAVGPQAAESTRLLCEWIWAGAIGPVREVHNWSSRPFWPQALDRPAEKPAVPEGLDWNLWLGPAPERPYHPIYQPFVWRGWHDFGCGSLGDMGCYSYDVIFRVLKLGAPTSVEAITTERYAETYPAASMIHYAFPARGEMPPVKLVWYDGGMRLPRPDELDLGLELEKEGLLFRGDRGAILCGFTGENPRLIPNAKMAAFQQPPKTLPRSPGNEREWLDACKGGKTRPGANFEFSSVVTESLLLGNVALRTGRKLGWDSAKMEAVGGGPEAQKLVRCEYRSGWSL